jgi:hypothetical protein
VRTSAFHVKYRNQFVAFVIISFQFMSSSTLPKVPGAKGETKRKLQNKEKPTSSLTTILVPKLDLPQVRSDSNSPL